jgi:hypothetical protein
LSINSIFIPRLLKIAAVVLSRNSIVIFWEARLVEQYIDFKMQDRRAAEWLLNFPEYKQAYSDVAQGLSELGAVKYTGMPRGSGIGKPVESQGIFLAELEKKQRWIMTIEDTERIVSEKKLAFLSIRRQAEKITDNKVGRSGWMDYAQIQYAKWHERRYGTGFVPSHSTLKMWWNEMVDIVVRIAIRRGCL